MGVSFADFNQDGQVGIYVTNYGPNRLYQNKGDGTFEEVGEKAGVDCTDWSTGVAWSDVDRDGDLDLYVCNYLKLGANQLASQAAANQEDDDGIPIALNPTPLTLLRTNFTATMAMEPSLKWPRNLVWPTRKAAA